MPAEREIEDLLAEQLAYYRARAPEYTETAIPECPTGQLGRMRDAIEAALESFRASGDVLELACGPGTWTPALLQNADSLTAVDGAPEMLALARSKVGAAAVRFIQADLFTWEPDRFYDVVFFGAWLSHVPPERFDSFWKLVDGCLKPGGRVAFVDDAYLTPEEPIEGEDSVVIRRRLKDGTPYQAVKVPHAPRSLEQQLAKLGWEIDVRWLMEPIYWGEGGRATRR